MTVSFTITHLQHLTMPWMQKCNDDSPVSYYMVLIQGISKVAKQHYLCPRESNKSANMPKVLEKVSVTSDIRIQICQSPLTISLTQQV